MKPLEAGFKLLVNKLHQDRAVACALRALRFWQDSLVRQWLCGYNRAADCKCAGPWFKSGRALIFRLSLASVKIRQSLTASPHSPSLANKKELLTFLDTPDASPQPCSGARAPLLSSDRAKKVPRGSEPRRSRLLLDSNLWFLDVRAGAHGPGLISNRRG